MLNQPTALIKKVPEPDYPWDRQADESSQAFEAFATYRDLGAFRSITAVVHKWHKSRSLIGKWSAAHEWVSRVGAWDAWNDQEFRKLREVARRELLDQQLELGRKMMRLAHETVVQMAIAGAPLQPKDVANFAKTGQALAANALGLDVSGSDPEQEAENRIAMQAIQEAIDAADKPTGDRVRQAIYRLRRECAARR